MAQMLLGGLGTLQRLSADLFLPARRLFGPLHRRRETPGLEDQEQHLPPLPEPWRHDARWYAGDFPPRPQTALQPLIDGHSYFTDLRRELAAARTRVTICGWCLTPLLALRQGEDGAGEILADVLAEVSERVEVYLLLWAGAPALFAPTTHYVRQVARLLESRAPKLRCALDDRAPFSHDHHQKAVTVDGRVAYVGGIDLCAYEGDRWDTPAHPLRLGPNWHDVQLRLQGEIVGDVEQNFCERWNSVTGERLLPLPSEPVPALPAAAAQVVRTVPRGFYPFAPKGIHGIRHALLAAIRKARHFVYLENQYLWAPEVVDALVEAMNRRRTEPFRIVLVLPAHAEEGRYDNDQHVRSLHETDAGRSIFNAYTLYAAGPAYGPTGYRYLPIYVHAKVTIVDDEWLSVGSANLNGRGLSNDTEMNVQAVAPDVARNLRIDLWSEHLGISREAVAAVDPIRLIDGAWKEAAHTMENCLRSAGVPPPGQVLRYKPGAGPASRVLDLIQVETFEH